MSFSLKCVVVPPYSKAVIYYNDKTAEYLDEGHYYYWNGSVDVSYKIFDMRVQQLDISGQDILTKDRVGVRVNFTANWKIIDYEKLAATYSNISQTLYAAENKIKTDGWSFYWKAAAKRTACPYTNIIISGVSTNG